MAGLDDAYSKFIALAKVLLPLAALALLSILFLFARDSDVGDLPFARVEAIAEDPRIRAPRYGGVARNGVVISLGAADIRPVAGQEDLYSAEAIQAELVMPDGRRIDISAGQGQFDERQGTASFAGLVRLVTSDGFAMETSGLRAWLDEGSLRSTGPVAVRAPFGDLDAGGVEVGEAGDRLLFTDGVSLLYRRPGVEDLAE